MPRFVSFVWLLFALSFTSVAQEAPLPRVQVEGNRFVDDAGRTVVFRGVSIADPDKVERDGHWNAALFDTLAAWGANVVRLPVHPSAWRRRGEAEYLRLLDEAVAWAGEARLYVVIDWHSIGNLRTEVFQHPMYETSKGETARFWRTVSARYAGIPTVAFYELFNEPTSYNGTLGRLSWAEHRAMMEDLIALVRANDPDAIPLVGGLDWAYDLSGVREDPVRAEGIAYVSHPYPQKRTPPWEPKWEELWGYVAARYPVFATELGFMSADGPGAHIPVIADETYGRAIVGYFEARGISWAAWVFDPQWAPQMIEDWTFAPTRQGRFFREAFRRTAPAGGQAPASLADSTAAVQVAAQFHEALRLGDSLAVTTLLLPEVLVLESGRSETRSEYLAHHYGHDVGFLRAMTQSDVRRTVRVSGDVAHVATASRLRGTYRDQVRDLESAELLVLHRTPEGWRVAAVHWSSGARE